MHRKRFVSVLLQILVLFVELSEAEARGFKVKVRIAVLSMYTYILEMYAPNLCCGIHSHYAQQHRVYILVSIWWWRTFTSVIHIHSPFAERATTSYWLPIQLSPS